ncbi:extracellular solute-binding protein [Caviibacter abscessus]|uniref:extracellular solute-binding protein n=1 Tax=Caviibacter abscessus TaxID=1766719 RepID=UPI00082B79A9|nr:extracellular solute-binding protein [Caviibacter abscessus]
MKKILYIFIIIFTLISCSGNREELNIYTWSEFIPEEVIEEFEKKENIKVNVSYYETNDMMLSKLLSGTDEYDIVSPSTDFIITMKKLNLISKLDKSKLNGIFENIRINKDIIDKYDKNLEYSIPYQIFATGISINKKYVDENDKDILSQSANIFSNKKYYKKMTMLDDARETLGLALSYLGYKTSTSNDKELEEAKKLLQEWKSNLVKLDNLNYGKGLIAGEFYIVHGYQDIFYELDEKDYKDYIFYLPKGALMYIDSMAILEKAKNKENAYKFLNYLYSKENYKKTVLKFKTPSVLKGLEDIKTILTLEEVLKNSTLPEPLDEVSKEKQDKIWNDIKLK